MLQAKSKLAIACGLGTAEELTATHAASLLSSMLQQCGSWTDGHADVPGFLSLLSSCPGVTLAALGEPLCLAIGSIVGNSERNHTLRMTLLRAVDALLEVESQARESLTAFRTVSDSYHRTGNH